MLLNNQSQVQSSLQFTQYPAPIRRYLVKAESTPSITQNFTTTGLSIFFNLIARTPIANPNRPIKVRVDATAAKLGCCEKTVQRVLNILKELGWIKPAPDHDGRNWRGRFSSKEFIVGDELRAMLGLPVNAEKSPEKSPEKEVEKEMSDGGTRMIIGFISNEPDLTPVITVNNQFSSTDLSTNPVDNLAKKSEMSDGHIVNENQKEAFIKAPFNDSPKIPEDLVPMKEALDLSDGGICALMRLARECKKRLQDIWNAKRDTILNSGATQGRAFHYLRKLIESPDDFSYIAQKNFQNETKDSRYFWNKSYAGQGGVCVRVFEDVAEVTRDRNNFRIVPKEEMKIIYDAIRAGCLKEIII